MTEKPTANLASGAAEEEASPDAKLAGASGPPTMAMVAKPVVPMVNTMPVARTKMDEIATRGNL